MSETPIEEMTAAPEIALETLEADICELAARQAAEEYQLLMKLAEFDRREGWVGWGIQSCAHWFAWKCGLGIGAAREKVRVARRLEEMPLVAGAFAKGELSYSKVRALARAVEPGTEETLLQLARDATTAQLESIVRAYRRQSGPKELGEDRQRYDRRSANWYWDEDGSLVINARLSPDDGTALVAALEAQRTALIEATRDAAETSSEPQMTNADALAAVARAALTTTGEGHGNLPAVVLHVDAAALPEDGPGRCHLQDGPGIPPATARRLGCDAVLLQLLAHLDGAPSEPSARTQAIAPAQRRALWSRDGGCRFPGCRNRRFVHAHHVIHWSKGGPTILENLVLLCSRHHRAVHEGGYHVTSAGPQQFRFFRPDRTPIPDAPTPPPPTKPSTATPAIAGDTLLSLAGRNEPYDLGLTLDVLLQANRTHPLTPHPN